MRTDYCGFLAKDFMPLWYADLQFAGYTPIGLQAELAQRYKKAREISCPF